MRLGLKIARIAGPILVAGVCVGASIAVGCGRIGIDQRELGEPDAAIPEDGPEDAPADAPPDTAPLTCPAGTKEIAPGSPTCIEIAERGTARWVDADAECQSLGWRLCADTEWATACNEAMDLVDMVDEQGGGSGSGSDGGSANWEWTGDLDGSAAKKRGYGSCDDTATHEIDTDPYDFRCCAAKS